MYVCYNVCMYICMYVKKVWPIGEVASNLSLKEHLASPMTLGALGSQQDLRQEVGYFLTRSVEVHTDRDACTLYSLRCYCMCLNKKNLMVSFTKPYGLYEALL